MNYTYHYAKLHAFISKWAIDVISIGYNVFCVL